MWEGGPCHGTILPGGIEGISSGTAITTRAKKAGLQVKHAANFIAGIYNLTDPDIVILGGSVAIKIEGFVEEVEVLVKSKVYEAQRSFIKVRKSILNEDSGLIGAAYLAFSKEK